MSEENSSPRRRVEWDEDNLAANEEYQRQHPVTMHIDEPKTPFVHMDDDVAEAMDRGEVSWDPKINALARTVREEAMNDRRGAPAAPVDKKTGRPMLHPDTTSGKLEEETTDRQFRQMRKAVYADEGANFKAMLAAQGAEDNEDEGMGKEADTGRGEERSLTPKQ